MDYRLGFTADPIAVAIEPMGVWGFHGEVGTVDIVTVPIRGRDAEVWIGR
jgi:hypothetical protein